MPRSRTPTSRRKARASPRLAEDELLGLLQKLIKQRQELVEIYDKAGRKELADQERGEIDIIRAYLPAADVGGARRRRRSPR